MIEDRYNQETGLLEPRPDGYQVDEVTIREPWPVDLPSCLSVIGHGSIEREALARHLQGVVGWFGNALRDDAGRRIWIRGDFASTLWPSVEELDVVMIYDGHALRGSDEWIMQLLASGVVDLHPGCLTVTAIRHNVDSGFEIAREARRSAVRVTDPRTNEQLFTGWLEIMEGGVE